MKLNEIYTSKSAYLKADDIKGQKPLVTIESVSTQTNQDQKTGEDYKQVVLHFVGKDKQLGLNFTNANTIAELLESDDTDDWIGKTIQLYTTMVQVGKEQKLGIRVMPLLPEQAPFTAPTESAQFTGANRPPDVTATPPDDADAPMNW